MFYTLNALNTGEAEVLYAERKSRDGIKILFRLVRYDLNFFKNIRVKKIKRIINYDEITSAIKITYAKKTD